MDATAQHRNEKDSGINLRDRDRWSVKFAVNDATSLSENCFSLLFRVKCLLSREIVCFPPGEILFPCFHCQTRNKRNDRGRERKRLKKLLKNLSDERNPRAEFRWSSY